MIYRNSGSLGLLLWSCGLGKRDNRSLSFLCPSVFTLFFLSFLFSLSLLLSHSIKLRSEEACLPTFDFISRCWVYTVGVSKCCRKALCQAVFQCCSLPACRGRRDLLSDSNRKAFISSTCHDPGTASAALLRYEQSQWKV